MSVCACVLCRFGIPFGLATSLGLAVRALDLPLTITEAGDGESCKIRHNLPIVPVPMLGHACLQALNAFPAKRCL